MKKFITLLGIVSMLALLLVAIPTPTLAQDVSCESDVVVQADDWLSKIADKFYGNVLAFPAIMEATNAQGGDYATITNPDVIEAGWKLCIPTAEYAQANLGEGMMMASTLEVTGDPVTLQFASVSVPDDAHTKGMQIFADAVSRISDGNITVDVFPGGQLFTQEGEQDALRSGNLDMAYGGPNWLAEFVPYMSMFAAPYMFTSYDHMSDAFNGPIGEQIFDDVAAQTGIRPLGAFYLGTRQLNLRDIGREVNTPADMEGVKLRMPNSPTWLFMGEALGANPTPLAFTEVYLGLQTGTIDGQDNPLPTDKNAKFYEVTKYIVLTDHYINPLFPMINEAKWQTLTPSQQEAVKMALAEAQEFVDKTNLDAEAELLEFFEGEGMTVITPDKQAFIDFAQEKTLGNTEMTSTWDMDLFNKIQAAASGGDMAMEEVTGDPVTLQFASVSVPDDAHTKGMQVFADEVAKLSNGNITVDIFPGGQLFTQEGEQDALRSGNLDMAYGGPNWLAEFVPYMSMFAAPYMFTSYDHMSNAFNGPIGQEIFDDVAAQTGIRPLGAFYLGTRQLNLRDIGREVNTPADMAGVKLRMPNSPTWLFMGEALGANPTPLAFTEVYLGLQTGTIDGQDNPLPTDKNAKFYEVTKYIVLTDHYINPLFPMINEAKWQSLTPSQQGAVLQALETARQFVDESNLQQEAELIEFFKGEGMTVITPDKQAFIDFAQEKTLGNEEMTSSWNMDLFNKIQESAQ